MNRNQSPNPAEFGRSLTSEDTREFQLSVLDVAVLLIAAITLLAWTDHNRQAAESVKSPELIARQLEFKRVDEEWKKMMQSPTTWELKAAAGLKEALSK